MYMVMYVSFFSQVSDSPYGVAHSHIPTCFPLTSYLITSQPSGSHYTLNLN